MSDLTCKIKQILTDAAKTVARFASACVKTMKFKLDELGNNSKRRDLFNELGKTVYEQAKEGLELPAAATGLIQQIQELDRTLEKLRADHAAQKAEAAATRAAEKEARAATKASDGAQNTTTVEATSIPADAEVQSADVPETADENEKPDVPTLNV